MTLYLRRLLISRSLNLQELTTVTGVPEHQLLLALHTSPKVHNVGSDDYPIWTWKIGKHASPELLTLTIRRLLNERPMSTQHLVEATDADPALVAAIVKKLQHLVRYGNMWFLANL